MNIKENIVNTLSSTKRSGMDRMIDFLENKSDFFIAPASTKYHLAYEGGLAEHSWNVRNTMHTLNTVFDTNIPSYQIDTVSLLHDVCKTGFYVQKQKWRKDDHDKWESYTVWDVEDQFPIGHGEKSLYMIGRFLDLSNSEAAAVRWHMTAFDPAIHFDYPSGYAFRSAADKYPLVSLLFLADYGSSQLVESRLTK